MSLDQLLTPEEARAVLDLHHLREKMRDVDGGYVGLLELREVLAVTPDELVELVEHVRQVLPARLAASEDHLSQREAELVVSYHARLSTDEAPPAFDFPSEELVEVARSRSAELIRLETRTYASGHIEEFEVKVGENPHSWAITWTVLGIISLILAILLLFFRG